MSPTVAGLCSVTFRQLPWEQVVEVAATAGLAAVEWGSDVHVPTGELATAQRVAAACADAGLTCASYGSYLFAGKSDDAEVGPTMDTAAELGAANVRVWCEMGEGPDAGEDTRARITDQLATFAEAGAARGLAVSLEFHSMTLTETAASTNRLLDDVGAPNLYTYWQPMDGVPVDELVGELRAVRSRLSHLHVFRWRDGGERLPLADGADLWPEALREAEDPGVWDGDRVAFLEFVRDDDPDQLAADAATLLGWLA